MHLVARATDQDNCKDDWLDAPSTKRREYLPSSSGMVGVGKIADPCDHGCSA
jgi:hypothetical protein